MPVFYNHKLVHIHIPKTAGTPIEAFFNRIGDMEWGPSSWVGPAKVNGRWYEYQHLSLMELRSLAESVFPGFTSFAVVRNPYTRLISDFIWRQWVKKGHPNSSTQFFDSFDEFINAIPKDINTHWPRHIYDATQEWANFLIHVRPQYHYVFDADDKCIVDAILRFEELKMDLCVFLARFGLSADNIQSPHIRPLGEYFNSQHISRVNEIYAKDFELFSYSIV